MKRLFYILMLAMVCGCHNPGADLASGKTAIGDVKTNATTAASEIAAASAGATGAAVIHLKNAAGAVQNILAAVPALQASEAAGEQYKAKYEDVITWWWPYWIHQLAKTVMWIAIGGAVLFLIVAIVLPLVGLPGGGFAGFMLMGGFIAKAFHAFYDRYRAWINHRKAMEAAKIAASPIVAAAKISAAAAVTPIVSANLTTGTAAFVGTINP